MAEEDGNKELEQRERVDEEFRKYRTSLIAFSATLLTVSAAGISATQAAEGFAGKAALIGFVLTVAVAVLLQYFQLRGQMFHARWKWAIEARDQSQAGGFWDQGNKMFDRADRLSRVGLLTSLAGIFSALVAHWG